MRGVALVAAALVVCAGTARGQDPVGDRAPLQVTLDEAIRLALRNNPGLDRSRSNLQIAEYNRLNTFGDFLPTLSLGYGYSNASTGRLDPTGQTFATTAYTLQLGASYDLFTGLRRFADTKAAQLAVRSREADFRGTEYNTIFLVKSRYYAAVAARELVAVEEDRVQRQENQLEFVSQQLELGRATRSDLLRSQVDLNNAKLALLRAGNAARTSTYDLAVVVGIDRRVEPVPESTLELVPFPFERSELVQMALGSAPSLVSAGTAAEAAEANIGSAKSAYLPNLRFSGGWAFASSSFPPANRSWSFSLQGNYPIFNGFQRETSVYNAQSQADIFRAQEREVELQLLRDVANAYDEVEVSLVSIALAENSVELSREDLRVVSERYRLGLATILDLQTAQIAVSQSEVTLIQERFTYPVGIAAIEALIGQNLMQ